MIINTLGCDYHSYAEACERDITFKLLMLASRAVCSGSSRISISKCATLLSTSVEHKTPIKMAFGDVKTPKGLQELNTWLAANSYINGYELNRKLR